MKIYIKSENIRLEIHGSQLMAIGPQKETPINIERLVEIWMHPDTSLSSGVLAYMAEYGVQVIALDKELRPQAILHRLVSPSRAGLRKWQLQVSLSSHAPRIAARWIIMKQASQLHMLESAEHQTRKSAWYDVLRDIVAQNVLLESSSEPLAPDIARESYFARIYFKALNDLLPKEFRFTSRSRTPAIDPVNALLNYGYGILYTAVTAAIQRVGLDPYTGFWHKERDGHPVLTYDMIEAFRPIVDKLVLNNITEGIWSIGQFDRRQDGSVNIPIESRRLLSQSIMKEIHKHMPPDDDRLTAECRWLVEEITKLAAEYRTKGKIIEPI